PRPLGLFVAVGATLTVLLIACGIKSDALLNGNSSNSWFTQLLVGFLFGMGFAHNWQDAFIWRFRESFNREAFLPYLKNYSNHNVAPLAQTTVAGGR
ncbi:MAG: hypothetical protein ACRD3W_28705, partial [Terriglobales bacterium]